MNFLKIIILVVSFGVTTLIAQDKSFKEITNIEQVKTKIAEYSSKTNSIKSDFVQEKHLEILETPLISKGKFYYKKQNNIRWEYTEPLKYIIVIHNGKFTIKDETKVSEYDIESNKMFKEINNMIITSMKGEIINNKDFNASFYENNTYYLAKLKPNKKEIADFISTIKIFFDKKDFSVSKVIMVESEQDYTQIIFKNKSINIILNESIFNIK